MGSRFDSIDLDDESRTIKLVLQNSFEAIEIFLKANMQSTRASSLAITKLEEAYSWIDKAIAADQDYRNRGNV